MKTLFTKSRKEDYLLSIILSVFMITLSICIVIFFKPFYYLEINLLKIDTMVDLSKSTIIHNYNQLIDYQSIFYKGKLILDDFSMSQSGRIHFKEVKVIFEYIQYACIFTGVLSIIGIVRNMKLKEYRYLALAGFFTVTIPLVLGFVVSLNFDAAFIKIHQLLFNNDYWLFDPFIDPVINILPDTYFYHCFILIVVIALAGAFICYSVYKRKYKEVTENKK